MAKYCERKVYLVYESYDYWEKPYLVGVYDNKAKAEKALNRRDTRCEDSFFYIREELLK